ncbi:MAG: VWA domain-containing protein [Chitinophagales bacterium]|nr:MAG: VWA domain-containing protein [Chitinophagales bacterium]
MFLDFFYGLRQAGIPVSLQEYLTLLQGLHDDLSAHNVEDFFYLSRSVLIKHETHLDKFDQLFGEYFRGMQKAADSIYGRVIPEEWLRKNLERYLTEEEKALIEALGGLDKLLERFRQLLEEQKERHEGGNKWIGTGGTSPFGAYGYNPEGFRIGQSGSRHRSAVKVWDQRQFANLRDDAELDTRNLKLALKRLRVFTREGIAEELDIDDTVQSTCRSGGMLDIKMIPSERNRVKVLMFFDIGGSMDDHIEICERLFTAARHEFRHLEFFYFHNCIYETVWRDNRRRHERIATFDVMHKYNSDYKVIIVGDAAMSPYEITHPGGSIEHNNAEAGIVWLQRLKQQYPYLAWINPNPEHGWDYFASTRIIREFTDYRMYPMTLAGIVECMKALQDKKLKYHTVQERN